MGTPKGKTVLLRGKVIYRQLVEGMSFTLHELKYNKLRTFLSLLGVSIGIFTIVAIIAAVDSLKNNVRKSFESLGSENVVLISQYPMSIEDEEGETSFNTPGEYKWWEYSKRPGIEYGDYLYLKRYSEKAGEVLFYIEKYEPIKYKRNSFSGGRMTGGTEDMTSVIKMDLSAGRVFSEADHQLGRPVTVLGYRIATELFGDEDPIGKKVKVGNQELIVIGTLKRQGQGMFNFIQTDRAALTTIKIAMRNSNKWNSNGSLLVIGKKNVSNEDLVNECRLLLRQKRRLRPTDKNNFSVGELSKLKDVFDGLLKSINRIGWIIASFSLLIGGFGIANIMFVSVKERTNIIGIQKALGAKRYFIMTQFLAEAIILATAGAAIGIILVAIIVALIPSGGDIEIILTLKSIVSGVLVAMGIGIVSGIAPAWEAANLNPVEAINSK